MVSFEGWGLSEVSKKSKINKIGECAAGFTSLGGLSGGCLVGVWCDWVG